MCTSTWLHAQFIHRPCKYLHQGSIYESHSDLVYSYYSLCPWAHCKTAAITNATASSIFCTIVFFITSAPRNLAFRVLKSLVIFHCRLGRLLQYLGSTCALLLCVRSLFLQGQNIEALVASYVDYPCMLRT